MARRFFLPALLAAPLASAGFAAASDVRQAEDVAIAQTDFGPAARRLQGGGFMNSVLSDMPQEGDGLAALSNASMEVIGSMVGSFLADQKMSGEERQCLEDSSQKFAGKIMSVASHVVMLIQEVTGQRAIGDIPGLPSGAAVARHGAEMSLETGVELDATTPAPKTTAAPKVERPKAEAAEEEGAAAAPWEYEVAAEDAAKSAPAIGRRLDDTLGGASILLHVSGILMELGYSIQLLVRLGKNVAKDCVKSDVVHTLELAGAHMRDIHYIGGHFLANGAEVVTEMSRSVLAYKARNYSQFGSMMGDALHKVLLSNISGSSHLPEGIAEKYMMTNMSVGFVKGFFGKGFLLGIKLDSDPQEPLRIDLEECIANNMVFFEQIWSAMAYAYAHKDDLGQQAAQQRPGPQGQKNGRVQLGTALAVAAMELPDALHRCHIGGAQADMLIDSVKAFGAGMHLTLSTPNKLASQGQITEDMGQTVRDWSKLKWYDFGFDLGLLCQELVLTLFPQKYSISDAGLLQRLDQLGEEAAAGGRGRGLALPLAAVCVSMLAAAAFRRDRAARRRPELQPCAAASSDVDMDDAMLL